MTFDDALTQTLAMLQRNGRVSFRALRRQFACDDTFLDDLRHEAVEVLRLATVEDGTVLVLASTVRSLPEPVPPLPVPPPAGPVRAAEGERRYLPVLFCDLADSTALAGRLDPEELGELYRCWQETFAAAAASYGGTVANYLGDGALIVFGHPIAQENSVDSAVGAALAIQAAWGAQQPAWLRQRGLAVAARIGIHHGLVLLTDLGGQFGKQQFSVGETPNIAARLQGLAGPGEVVVSQQVIAALRSEVLHEPMGEQHLKGVTRPIATFRIKPAGGRPHPKPGRGAGLVGRGTELADLESCLRQAVAGSGQVVHLSGEPGIGKSRLVAELAATSRAAGVPHIVLRCAELSGASALHPVIEHLRRLLHGADAAGDAPGVAGLDALIRGPLGSLADEAVPLVAHLLSLPGAPAPAAAPGQVRSRTFDVLLEWLVRVAEPDGLLLVVEDLHWCDPSTVEMLGGLVDRRIAQTRILLVGTSRPDAGIPWPEAAFRQISLRRLSRQDTAAMIAGTAGGKPLPAAVVDALAARSEGVPLFTEELVASMLASGQLRDAGDRYELDVPLSALPDAETLHGSLTARLDRVGEARDTALVAAAVGREFSFGFLSALGLTDDDTLARHLRLLTAAKLLEEARREPDGQYRFRHALIQEAAYGVMLRPRRQQIHRRIATVLTERFAGVTEAEPEFAAHHFTEAGLIEDAVRLWRVAGERALNRCAGVEAQRHFERALGLVERLDAGPARLSQHLALQVALGSALLMAKGQGSDEVGAAFQAAYELSEGVDAGAVRDTADVLPVLYGLWRFLLGRSRLSDALDLAERFLSLAEKVRPPLRAVGHVAVGLTFYNLDRLRDALPHLEQGVALHEAGVGAQEDHAAIRMIGQNSYMVGLLNRAMVSWLLGQGGGALDDAARAVAFAEAAGNKLDEAVAHAWTAKLHKVRRDPAALAASARRAMQVCEAHGFTMWFGAAQALHGSARAMSGDADGGLQEIRDGTDAMEATGSFLFRTRNLLLAAEACLRTGAVVQGLAAVREAVATHAQYGERWWLPELHRLEGELLLAAGPDGAEAAEACCRRAVAAAAGSGLDGMRLRATTDLARLLSATGRQAEAVRSLLEALAPMPPGWDNADRTEAMAVLADLG